MTSLRTELATRLDELEHARIECARNRSMAPSHEVASRIDAIDSEAAVLRQALARSLDKDAEDEASKADKTADYWLKRFITTLGIANAAAFAALATALLKEDASRMAPLVVPAMKCFAWGMLIAGAIPACLWVRYKADGVLIAMFETGAVPEKLGSKVEEWSQYLAFIAALVSIGAFAAGIFTALGSAQGIIPR